MFLKRLLLGAAAVLGAASLILAADPLLPGGEPLQPESLEQGFVLLVTDKTGRAATDSPIYVASNHNGWNPNDPTQRLTRRSDGKWQIALPKPKLDSRMAFKFTRGSWDLVEVGPEFADIKDRGIAPIDPAKIPAGAPPVIELSVEHWRDERPNEPVKFGVNPFRTVRVAAGRIARVEVTGGGVPVVRDLLVWLPPGYDDAANASRRYPVLYMQDGQNIFEAPPGVPGEWQVDETAARLISERAIEPLIVVGIPSIGALRMSEYCPVPLVNEDPVSGDAYVEFLVKEVVPRVERGFRVRSGPTSTGIGGSSLGAIIALHAATKHPDVFGRVLAESPTLTIGDGRMLRFFENVGKYPERIYIGMGGKEGGAEASAAANARYAASVEQLKSILLSKGVAPTQIQTLVRPDDAHDEPAWAGRLSTALKFLFPAP